MDVINETKAVLKCIQDKCDAISESTERIYHGECKMNKKIPNLYILENVKRTKISDVTKPVFSAIGDFLDEFLPEIQKLEKQLETADNKKSKLAGHSQESQQLLGEMEAELSDQHSNVLRMIDHIHATVALYKKFQEIEDEEKFEHSKRVQIHNNRVKKIEDNLHMSYGTIHETRAVLNMIQNKLIVVYEELEQEEMSYQMMGDCVKGSYKSGCDSTMNFEYSDNCKELVGTIKSAIPIKFLLKGGNEIETMSDSTKACNILLDTIGINCQKSRYVGSQGHSAMDELRELCAKLLSLQCTKLEQAVTMNAITKVINISFVDLESECEKEMTINRETIVKICSELYALKENAATFPSLGAMFATQCEKYIAELNEKLVLLQEWQDSVINADKTHVNFTSKM